MRSGFDFADVVEDVVETALGETGTAADIITARRSIFLLLTEWSAQQLNTWRINTEDIFVPAAAAPVTLDSRLDDILNVKTIRNGADETPVTRISETIYAALTDKTITGQPVQYMLRRTEPPAMYLYPIGRPDGETIRITYVSRPAAFDRYGSESDVPERWLSALVHGAATKLVLKRPERFVTSAGYSTFNDRYNAVKAEYEKQLALATINDRQRTGYRFRI